MRTPRSDSPFGSRLLGGPDEPVERTSRRVQLLLTAVIMITNLIGAVVVTTLAAAVTPGVDALRDAGVVTANLVAVPAYIALALLIGSVWGTKRVRPELDWVLEERVPSADEQRAALRVPIELVKVQLVLWGVATVAFAVLNGRTEARLASQVGFTVALGGTVVCAIAYLLSEFIMRPLAAKALSIEPPADLQVPGVLARALLAWGLGLLPVVGLMGLAASTLWRDDTTVGRLAVTVLALGGTALAFGLLLAVLAARATVDPIKGLRQALARVASGDLDVSVAVYDGTEVGLLQAGFNRAVAGLRERERVRDLFGRHVGEDVARAALERGTVLGGEVRDVAVLFVDVIGSTGLAATRRPDEVVQILNRFFAVVVDVVGLHGGFVNKFEGDGALAVFGAPTDLADAPGAALATARSLRTRLRVEVEGCRAAIGVAAGPAVAGNVGDERRYEYTVIGDPVNEASRLCDLAKDLPGLVAASMRVVEAAGPEGVHWMPGDEVLLRGRVEPTTVATPVDA